MNRLQAVFFDFDGVIADSEPLHLRAFQQALAEEGIELTPQEYYSRYLGFDDVGVFEALGERGAVHLRARNNGRRVYDLATQLAPVHQRTKCWLVINDRIDVALACGVATHALPVAIHPRCR